MIILKFSLIDTLTSVNLEKKQVEMSFRSTEAKETRPTIQITDLTEGDKVNGTVKKIEDYGLFIEIEGSKLRGLFYKSEVTVHHVTYIFHGHL